MIIAALPPEGQASYRQAIRWRVLDGVLFGLSIVVALVALPFVVAQGLSLSGLVMLIAVIFAVTLGRYIAGGQWLHLANSATLQGGTMLRQRLLRHLIKLPHNAYTDLHAGKIGQTLSEEMLWLENHTAQQALATRGDLAAIACILAATALVHWPAALAALVIWGVGLGLMIRAGTALKRQIRDRTDTASTAARDFLEYAEGIQVVRAFGSTETDDTRFAQSVEAMRARFNDIVRQSTPATAVALGVAMSSVAGGALVAVFTVPLPDGAIRAASAIALLTAVLIPARAILIGANITNLS